jgi:hypothetical protein
MEKIITIIEEQIQYKAIDGTVFNRCQDCLEYEEYLAIKDEVMAEFKFYNYNEKTKQFLEIPKEELQLWSYGIAIGDKYEQYRKFLPKDFSDIRETYTLYKRDYSAGLSGGYGHNGWFKIGNREKSDILFNFFKDFKGR